MGLLRILIIEDSEDDAVLLVEELRQGGYEAVFERVETAAELDTALSRGPWDLVLADYRLPHFSAPAALACLQAKKIDLPLIIVSGAVGEETAISAMKAGAHDFVAKNRLTRLVPAVARELREAAERHRRRQAEELVQARTAELEQAVGQLRLEVAERKRAEKALALHADDLRRSNAELERFAYVCSHDLQEPLRMVISFTALLSKRYKHTLDKDAQEFIEFAANGAARMQELIKELLAFSRIGKEGEPGSTDAARALESALENLGEAIANSHAKITSDALPIVRVNSVHLVQIFQNLIGNAIKFRKVNPPQVHVSAQAMDRTPGQWMICVKDNGIGIDPEYADQIFTIFQRLHTRSEYEGNGIGLAICQKIVDLYGGKIWVDSQPGKGATFCFTLPAAESEEFSPE